MVARSGDGWVLAPCLGELMDQADAAWPDRDTASDGSIGDARHQAESFSDHNPRQGADGVWYVSAVDITADDFSDALAFNLTLDARVKYVIWDRRYYQRVPWSDDPVGAWVPYTGSDPHTGHIHVSVQMSSVGDIRPWVLPEVDMSLSDEDVARVAQATAAAGWALTAKGLADPYHNYLPPLHGRLNALEARVTGLQAAVTTLAAGSGDPAALKAAIEGAMRVVLGSLDNPPEATSG
jgi:hypothetical protein